MSVVLMYHALYVNAADLERIDVEDRPYAVRLGDFVAQMEQVARLNHGVIAGPSSTLPDVVVTFDDGHISNVEHALPVLRRLGIRAYFFVTTGFIGSRAHFCGWGELAQLVDSGMIIGSHGISHRFFDDMTQADIQHELHASKELIQQQLEHNAWSISFPGGRYTNAVVQAARELGYYQIFGSDFGQITGHSAIQGNNPIRRIPIRHSTSLNRFGKLVRADRTLFILEMLKTQSKRAIKSALGNRIYHGLYTALAKNR